MTTKGLEAKDYSGWIDNSIEITPVLQRLLSEYLIGSPAYGLSQKGRDLYSFYGYKTIDDYDSLYKWLLNGIDFHYYDKYEDLKLALLSDDTMSFTNTLPELKQEQIYIYSGTVSDSNFFKAYFKIDSIKGKKKDQLRLEASQRKKTVALDKLFCHIRNALAHGCFTLVKDDQEYLVLQDKNTNNFISARAIISINTLFRWADGLNQRKEYLDENNI